MKYIAIMDEQKYNHTALVNISELFTIPVISLVENRMQLFFSTFARVFLKHPAQNS
jgi:hypothetical protein